MAKTTRQLLLGVMVMGLIAGFNRPASAQENEASTIFLQVNDYHRISLDVLERAQAETSRILRSAGIEAVWIHDPSAKPTDPMFTLLIPNYNPAAFSNISRFALGFAPCSLNKCGTMAYVLAERVTEVSNKYNVDLALLLGLTMAHEIGHLLLPAGHSDQGLMKADWSNQEFRQARDGRLLFTQRQVGEIRTRLSGSSAK